MPANYIIPGIENKMSELGFDSIYCSFDYILSLSPDDAEKSFKNSGINGLIFCSNYLHGNERSLQILKKTGLPGVIPHTHRAKDAMVSGYAVQVFDEKGSFKTAICHLAEKGHCRIGSIMHKGFTPNFRNYSKDEYFNLLESLGMETKNEFFKLTSYEPEEIKSATEELMKTHIPPTAIMCYSDFYAIHVYSALKNMSLKIPEDVAVMGYCGYPGGELMSPSLSTVDLQYFELGKSAVELLARSDEWFDVKEKTAPPIIQTNYKLIARESTAIKRLERKMKGLAV
jgi:DNA-binding LacI/PurR family transcriptional regulator